jgi:CheY-like chemotaxis protein
MIHSVYRNIFSRYEGCSFFDAMNGLEALDILDEETGFDLILLDMNMPIMSGLQFMEKIRRDNLYPQVPIIVVSAAGQEEDTLRALKLGVSGYVVKPFDPAALCDLIDKVLAGESPLIMQ